jgi:hypothetical protein
MHAVMDDFDEIPMPSSLEELEVVSRLSETF